MRFSEILDRLLDRLLDRPLDRPLDRTAPPAAKRGATLDDDANEIIPEVVRVEIGDSIDLHSFSPRDIPGVVRAYLHEARARRFQVVRIIHGKGKGTQRRIVRRILDETGFVVDSRDAPSHSGGWGATIARLDTAIDPDDGAPPGDPR